MIKYFIAGILLIFLIGIANAVPYCPVCGETITENIELNCSLNCTGAGLVMGSDGVIVDCRGNSIAGSGSGYGVHIRQKKNTAVENCTIKGFSIGVYIEGIPSGESGSADNNIIRNSNISSNTEGVRIYACGCGGSHSNNNILENNKIFNNTDYGVFFVWNSKYNKILNNTINNNGCGVYIKDSYSEYNEINSSAICSNNFDVYLNSGTGNKGSNNTCNTTYNWKDNEAEEGCAYKCVNQVNLSDSAVNYTVHEWGVWQQDYVLNFTGVYGAHPPGSLIGKIGAKICKPVIHFYSNASFNADINVSVNYSNAANFIVIPNATVSGNKIVWDGIRIENNSIIEYNNTYLNPNSSDIYIDNDTITQIDNTTFKYKYLFYESDVVRKLDVEARIFDNETSAEFYVRNLADYVMYDVFFVYVRYLPSCYGFGCGFHKTVSYMYAPQLNSYENISLIENITDNETLIKSLISQKVRDKLVNRGLTLNESNELVDYWTPKWFYGDSFMLYTIPQEIYDSELPIELSPKPDNITRVGVFYIKNIPSENNLSCDKILPDLKADKITCIPENPVSEGNPDINITITIINSGNISLNLDSVNVSLFIDGAYENNEILNLTNKTEINITFNWTAVYGEHNITLIIDPDNKINESDETNNNITAEISVSSGICLCSNCSDCEEKLNNSACLNVALTSDILNHHGACINNPENFNKKTFDCRNHKIEGDGTYFGIYLNTKTENTIENCLITGFYYGIYTYASTNNQIKNTILNNNGFGISLYSSTNNRIINNSAENNSYGIYLYSSSNNRIINTKSAGNFYGMHMYYSLNNSIINNRLESNQYGIYMIFSGKNYIDENQIKNNDYGLYVAWNSDSNNLKNNEIKNNNNTGIYFTQESDNNNLNSNNICFNNIDINKTGSNSGENNTCDTGNWNDTNNNGCAHKCVECVMVQSGCCSCSGGGDMTCMEKNAAVAHLENLSVSCNNTACIALYLCDFYASKKCENINNTCVMVECDRDGDGFNSTECGGSDCDDNNASIVPAADNLKVNRNTTLCPGFYNLIDSDTDGIIIINANNVVLDCNNATINGSKMGSGFGIAVFGYNNVTIKNCNLMNYDYGIFLNSSNSTVTENNISHNYRGGIIVSGYRNTIVNNNINLNSNSGIYLMESENNTVTRNNVNLNDFGIRLYYSLNNIVIDNIVCYNNESDFNLTNSSGNFGHDNACDKPDGWNDTGTIGCAYSCGYIPSTPSDCNCSSCSECNEKLNDSSCSIVTLNTSITNYSGTCINNPVNFTNKIFDCQGHIIDGNNISESCPDAGIYLNNKQNNTIKNCIITNFMNGIYLDSLSNNNILTSNTANNNNHGIYFGGNSNNNMMISNNLCNNLQYDVYNEENSNSTTGDNNTCAMYYNYNDINATGCDYVCSIDSCNCSSCEECSYKLSHPYCSQVNLTTNITHQSGICINNPANFNNKIFDCQGHTINGNGIDDGWPDAGIYLNKKQNNTIKNCKITDFRNGICLVYSLNNNIINNTANSNTHNGIYLSSSSNNTLTKNAVNSNNDNGISLGSSSNNILTSNTANNNTYDGIYLDFSSNNNMIANNTVSSNSYGIILFSSSNNNMIANNTVSSNSYGIILFSSSNNNMIANNTVNSNSNNGVHIYKSSNNNLTNNTVNSNNVTGIFLGHSSKNTLMNNLANSNEYGIYILDNSNFNKILNNEISNNNETGITISNCLSLEVCYDGNSDNEIEDNEILNNKIGIFSQQSNSVINRNKVCNNVFDFNSSDWLSSSGENNTCATGNWNDSNASGCAFSCVWKSCFWKYNLSDNVVVFYHSRYCSHCMDMMPVVMSLEGKGYKFYWAEYDNQSAMSVLRDCLSSLFSDDVPEFICSLNNRTILGEVSEGVLENFTAGCGQRIYGVLMGFVRDEYGSGLVNATVSLNGLQAQTNSLGEYVIETLIGGYEVSASAQSYYPVIKNIVVENKTIELNFTLISAEVLNASGELNALECNNTINYSIIYSTVCPSTLNLTLNALRGNTTVNISFGDYILLQNLSDLSLNYSFYGVENKELKITVCNHTVSHNISCKKAYGASCSTNNECFGFCVHNKCRNSTAYCGDNYCDSGETCFNDCGSSGGSSDNGQYCASCVSGGSGGGGSGGVFFGISVPVYTENKILSLYVPSGTVVSGVFNFTVEEDKITPVVNAKISVTLENGSVIEKNTDKEGNAKFDLSKIYGKIKLKAEKSGFKAAEKEFTLIFGNLKIYRLKGIKYGDEFEFYVHLNDVPVENASVDVENKIFKTDENGTIKAVISKIGGVLIKADKEGYNKTSLEINVKPKGILKIIKPDEVKAGETILIKVVDEYNNIVQDPTVYINGAEYKADADGVLEVNLKENGVVEVKAVKEGYLESKDTIEIMKEEKPEIKTKQDTEKENLDWLIIAAVSGLIIAVILAVLIKKRKK